MKRNSGFTLIELVVVIIILGVLAVVALPKFISSGSEAHQAVVDSTFSKFKESVRLYHYGWLTEGTGQAVENLASFGDGTVDSNDAGYPINTDGSGQIKGEECGKLWQAMVNSDLTITSHAGSTFDGDKSVQIKYWYGSDHCYYIYVGEHNELGVNLPHLTYYPADGSTEITYAAYGNNS
ncbi:type II secretion system protein [Ferrimonas aestuarii]|nr:prepilin-type N-terminal cleavage/methylation domain-containing protein [Ferrimonas aestuarii]